MRIFADGGLEPRGEYIVTGEDFRHIAYSLRMRCGEKVTVCDTGGVEYGGELTSIGRESAVVILGEGRPCEGEPRVDIALYVALPKRDKLEFVIQKAVELGVCSITPVVSARSLVKYGGADAEAKLESWQKISAEAAKHSDRGKIPRVCAPVPFGEALEQGASAELCLFCHEGEGTVRLSEALRQAATVAAFTGPEGGFTEVEKACAEAAGYAAVSLGKRILRCETAPLCLISALLYAFKEI